MVKCDVGITYNGIIKCEKKIRELRNVTKEQSHVMLKLHNVRMELLNARKKKTTKCDKRTVTYDVGII